LLLRVLCSALRTAAAAARALQAVESRITAEAAEKLGLAFAAVESDEARARLTEWQDTELAERTDSAGSSGASNSNRPVLMVLRLSGDELGFRCESRASHDWVGPRECAGSSWVWSIRLSDIESAACVLCAGHAGSNGPS
jgi:hypothetical protein